MHEQRCCGLAIKTSMKGRMRRVVGAPAAWVHKQCDSVGRKGL